MKNTFGKILACAFAFLLLFVCVVPAAASNEFTTCDGKIKVANGDSGTLTNSDGSFTAEAIGTKRNGEQTNTITITNNTEVTAEIGFSWSAKKTNTWATATANVNGTKKDLNASSSTTGNVSVSLNAGESITILLCAKGSLSDKNTATMALSNFSWRELKSDYSVKVQSNGSGSITVNGTAVANGSVHSLSASEASTLVATAGSGTTFLGWRNADTGALFGTNATLSFTPVEDMTLEAMFISKTAPQAWFQVEDKYMFSDLNDANNAAVSGNKIILMNTGTLAKGNYSIKSGVTLLIPFDAANTCYTTSPKSVESYTTPSAYRTLTMASGASITVNGAISVSGKHCSVRPQNGFPSGKQGVINMQANSSITVESGANLYAWGYIAGSGSVEIKSGGTVYEYFQVADFRGGTATLRMKKNESKVFPLSQYYVQNVQVPLKLNAGASETAYVSFTMNVVGTVTSSVPFVGDSGMFQIENGYIIKDYDEQTDRLILDIYGDFQINSYTLKILTDSFDSSDYVLPINQNITVNVNSGTTTINQTLALLPEAQLNVAEGATCKLGSGNAIYVYDLGEWGNYVNGGQFKPLPYSYGSSFERTALTKHAQMKIDGTLDASAGYLYTTSSGANICSDGTGTVILQAGTETTTYQATQSDSISYVDIAINPAYLKNADGSYVHSTAGTYYYDPLNGKWTLPAENVDSVVCATFGVSLDSEILLYFRLKLPESGVDKVVLVKDGARGTVTKEYTAEDISAMTPDSNGRYTFFIGVASGEMGRSVSIYALNADGKMIPLTKSNGTQLGCVASKTVADYARIVLAKDNDARRDTIIAMLTYGGYAQKYFDVDPNQTVHDVLAEFNIQPLDISTVTTDMITNANSNESDIEVKSSTAILDSALALRVTFVTTDISSYMFKLDGTVLTPQLTDDGKYYITISDIAAAEMNKDYQITVHNNATNEDKTITTSVLAYVKNVIKNTDNEAEKIDLAKAMYLYNSAAYEYFSNRNEA